MRNWINSDEGSFMGKKMAIFVVALLLFTLSLALPPKAHSQTQNVQVSNYSWYIDPEGYLDVVGLVKNVGPNTISSISLAGSVIGPQNMDLDDSGTQVWVSDLLPNQEAPFYLEFVSPQVSSSSLTWPQVVQEGGLSSIEISVVSANATSDYQYQGLTIKDDKGSVGTTGNFNGAYGVSGVIENTGDQSASNLTVVGAFFNSTGSVVGVGFTTYLTPTVLVPGNSTTFDIYALDLNQSQVPAALQIKSYQLLVQCGGPILQGNQPIVSPEASSTTPTSTPGSGTTVTGTTAPTATPSPTAQTHATFNFSSILPIAVAVVIAVVIVSAAIVVFRQVMSRKPKPRMTVKEAKKTKKQNR